jgi:hypothetical protein
MPDELNHQAGYILVPDSVANDLAEVKDRLYRLETAYALLYQTLQRIVAGYESRAKEPANE